MSERRKDQPLMPDRLPGEAELSELYQENTQEQPSVVVDQLILNEARKAVQPPAHLRLVFRRWTLPLTLAAGLLVSIGVMTTLEDEVSRPSKYVGFGAASERQTIVEAQKPAEAPMPKGFASDQAASSSATERKRVQEAQTAPLRHETEARDPSGSVGSRKLGRLLGGIVAEDMSSGSRQRTDKTPLKSLEDLPGVLGIEPNLPESPNRWLNEITDLFRAGHRRAAEERLRAFQRKYPRFDNFPEDFPQELLDKVSVKADSHGR